MWDDDEPRSAKIGRWVWGALQVAMLVGALFAASFGVYMLFLSRVRHHF